VITICIEDWDANLVKQRANPWAKRIQLLYRVRLIIKKFKELQKKRGIKNKKESKAYFIIRNRIKPLYSAMGKSP